jgi:hypothetical protein
MPTGDLCGGIEFHGRVDLPDGFEEGEWCWGQTVKSDRPITNMDGSKEVMVLTGVWCLDKSFPYGRSNEYSCIYETGTGATTSDSPAVILTSSHRIRSADDLFTTYQMFRPAGVVSCWVPLRSLDWHWNCVIERQQDGSWGVVSSGSGADEASSPCETHPEWENNIKDAIYPPKPD